MKKQPPAITLEGREKQMVGLAVDLAEKQLREGTASPTVINHYLRLGTTSYEYELERIRQEVKLLEARTAQIESSGQLEQLYLDAIAAINRYNGSDHEN